MHLRIRVASRLLQNSLVEEMSKNQLVFFGVHGESAVDQQTAVGVMGRVATKLKEKVAIGLEQVGGIINTLGEGVVRDIEGRRG